jgi:hypothetical protein
MWQIRLLWDATCNYIEIYHTKTFSFIIVIDPFRQMPTTSQRINLQTDLKSSPSSLFNLVLVQVIRRSNKKLLVLENRPSPTTKNGIIWHLFLAISVHNHFSSYFGFLNQYSPISSS